MGFNFSSVEYFPLYAAIIIIIIITFSADSGIDFEDSGTVVVSFVPADIEGACISLSIPVMDDLILELNETFLIELGTERDPSIIVIKNSTLISIIDNDRKSLA